MRIIIYLLQYILIKLFFFICKIIGYKKASNLGELIGKKVGPKFKSKKIIERNINLILPDTKSERVDEIKSMGLKVIKAIKIKNQSDLENYKKYDNADVILFDTPGMEKSIEFPRNLISKIPRGEKYALAGSISQNNIENIAKLGVTFCDLSSSLELDTQIGYKDHSKIKKFIKKVNELKN